MTITDIGRRVELVAMDQKFHDISLGLYEQMRDDAPVYLVHTYSTRRGSAARVRFIREAMTVLGGMTVIEDETEFVGFDCATSHQLMVRRIFLEATKVPPDRPVEARPLTTVDGGTDCEIQATSNGCEYHVYVEAANEACERRAAVAAKGLARLAEMELVPDTSDRVRFRCGVAHDAAVGLLLPRALNVRTAMREIEEAASRGVLAPPSGQGQ